MNLLAQLKTYILPKEVDFFGNLTKQCRMTEDIINELYFVYVSGSEKPSQIRSLIDQSTAIRTSNLIELSGVLITPVDKEAISRLYVDLHWIALSVKHLDMEICAYHIKSLNKYENVLGNLKKQMHHLTTCFDLLNRKKYEDVLEHVYHIIQYDDKLILEYADHLNQLFDSDHNRHILERREILSQLKEISKRIHFCANSVEDIVFKMH